MKWDGIETDIRIRGGHDRYAAFSTQMVNLGPV